MNSEGNLLKILFYDRLKKGNLSIVRIYPSIHPSHHKNNAAEKHHKKEQFFFQILP
jgi:hypothetical protein